MSLDTTRGAEHTPTFADVGPLDMYRVRKTRRRDRMGRPWVLRWFDPPGSSRMRQTTIGPMSERLAERHRELWQAELNGLRSQDDGAIPWPDFKDAYLDAKGAELAKASVDLARRTLARFERTVIPTPRRLADVDFETVEAYRIGRLKEVDAETVRKEIRTLRAAFSWAVHHDHISENPFARVRWGRRVRKDVESLSQDATDRFLGALHDEPTWIWASLRLAVLWGPRAGELAHLERPDVDFREHVVRIRVKGRWTPKAGRGRVLPLDLESEGLFQELVHAQRVEHRGQPVLWGPCRSTEAYKRRLRSAAKRIYGALGTLEPKKCLHVLRATAETNMRRRGVPAHIRRSIIGHTSDTVSDRHYDGMTPEESARCALEMMG